MRLFPDRAHPTPHSRCSSQDMRRSHMLPWQVLMGTYTSVYATLTNSDTHVYIHMRDVYGDTHTHTRVKAMQMHT